MQRTKIAVAQEKLAGDERLTKYMAGNSQLLIDYRDALILAYGLGENIKELYGIIPPKCIVEAMDPTVSGDVVVISLSVN
jgi:hypothetical protein